MDIILASGGGQGSANSGSQPPAQPPLLPRYSHRPVGSPTQPPTSSLSYLLPLSAPDIDPPGTAPHPPSDPMSPLDVFSLAANHGPQALPPISLQSSPIFSSKSSKGQEAGTKEQELDLGPETRDQETAALFYQPGKRGFYSPRQARPSEVRLNAFRNVGRLLGLCLLQNELCPLFLNRHVIKYILSRPVKFHDLAFFDPVIYESLRQLVVDAEKPGSDNATALQALDLTFSIDLCAEEGGGSVELVPGGRDIEVTSANIYQYVRKYAQYRMVTSQEKALKKLREGLFDVIPAGALDTLTAEDFRYRHSHPRSPVSRFLS